MHLDALGLDTLDPHGTAAFWSAALGAERVTEEEDLVEIRLQVDGGPRLDIGFQRVPEAPAEPLRLHLDLTGAARQAEVVERLLDLGARHLDVGQGDVPWVVLADPEGTPFCVMEGRPEYQDTGPVAALPIDSADPERDSDFWSWLTGWVLVDRPFHALRHPSRRGMLLEFCPEPRPKEEAKNRWHLDVRLDPGESLDDVATGIALRGGREVHHDWGVLPWRVFQDPSGNEFCVLPQRP